ncbi:uncharacterized protein DUF559 [Ilumatobacter fluminis]|uniref:Uncharacterized protein DUF559 n=1 Tax=Ilumatobacter fluminis TaxID=467091 RepID=A0A4R7I0T8_9ACTN|nr:uncharacterized protein DUF559 [Ilumatobacter fluminis]
MRPLPRAVLDGARRQHGLVTATDLRRADYAGRARTDALACGLLVRVHKGVYRIGSHAETFEQRSKAALLAAPDAVLAGPTAARFWNLRSVRTDDVHILALRAIKLRGVHAHRTDLLRSGDSVEKLGFRLLAPARLLCDLARFIDEAELESVFEQMLDRRIITVSSARQIARRFCRPGRPGSQEVARLLDARPEWLKPVGSELELRVWKALARVGHALERQVEVEVEDGSTVRLDLAQRECRIGIEVDHTRFHGGRLDVQGDKRRDRLLTALGWTIVRITDEDVDRRFVATVDELVRLLDRRIADLRAAS